MDIDVSFDRYNPKCTSMKTTTFFINLRIIFILFFFPVLNAGAQTLMTGIPVSNSSVYAFEKDGNTVYMGGIFTQVNSVAHWGLARFDAVTGIVDSWNPSVNNNGVSCLAKAAGKLIAGGAFSEMNGQQDLGSVCLIWLREI